MTYLALDHPRHEYVQASFVLQAKQPLHSFGLVRSCYRRSLGCFVIEISIAGFKLLYRVTTLLEVVVETCKKVYDYKPTSPLSSVGVACMHLTVV